MGIGNLNNNFGNLTAGNVNKANNLKNTGKVETTLNNNISNNADSLNSATLGDNEGKLFDSDNLRDRSTMLYAPKGKGKSGKTTTKKDTSFGASTKEGWDRVGGMENYNGKGADEMGFSVLITSAFRWAWRKIFG